MSEDAATVDDTEVDGTEGPEDLDELLAHVVEEYGGGVAALEMLVEERAERAKEEGCHPSQLEESRRHFVLRRKLEVAAIKERKAGAGEAETNTRRASRAIAQEGYDVLSRRNRGAARADTKAAKAAERASPKPTHGDPTAEEQAEAQRAKEALEQVDRTEELEAEAAKQEAEAEARAEADAAETKRLGEAGGTENPDGTHGETGATKGVAEPAVVQPKARADKNLTAENLEGLNVGALKALAKKKGLTVERADGDGDPVRSDYVAALLG